MGTEIEKKFLLRDETWRSAVERSLPCKQMYLPLAEPGKGVVRVRIMGERAFLTLKTASSGDTRGEYEYPIPVPDAREIMGALCSGTAVEKVRHIVFYGGFRWEIDEFSGENQGLFVAEIELTASDEPFPMPPWAGEEVTLDRRYSNSSLSKMPFNRWKT